MVGAEGQGEPGRAVGLEDPDLATGRDFTSPVGDVGAGLHPEFAAAANRHHILGRDNLEGHEGAAAIPCRS